MTTICCVGVGDHRCLCSGSSSGRLLDSCGDGRVLWDGRLHAFDRQPVGWERERERERDGKKKWWGDKKKLAKQNDKGTHRLVKNLSTISESFKKKRSRKQKRKKRNTRNKSQQAINAFYLQVSVRCSRNSGRTSECDISRDFGQRCFDDVF